MWQYCILTEDDQNNSTLHFYCKHYFFMDHPSVQTTALAYIGCEENTYIRVSHTDSRYRSSLFTITQLNQGLWVCHTCRNTTNSGSTSQDHLTVTGLKTGVKLLWKPGLSRVNWVPYLPPPPPVWWRGTHVPLALPRYASVKGDVCERR